MDFGEEGSMQKQELEWQPGSKKKKWTDVWEALNLKTAFPKPQFKTISSSVLSFFYVPTLPCIHDDCWENLALTYGPLSVK